MRVIAGKWKGLKLQAPHGLKTRPTADRVREGIFSVLGDKVKDTYFLDLFAGSGSVGLEALSRGAHYVVFVEQDVNAIKSLRKNIARINAEKNCIIYPADGFRINRVFHRKNTKFDIVYMDPPFFIPMFLEKIKTYFTTPVIHENGLMILEHFHKIESPADFGKLEKVKEITYGDTGLSLYNFNLSSGEKPLS
ncbi:MAG: 16S rRNA (guanine(966)-N(2))-methyltransferase RsmD [Candidatus Schekmanbacteria bacterium RBG_13_48_7]|uniref:16S rRNA (Guanine(966)-N(2))-methyltransferase RsmD n=1 Tax=Candidatus Schekmanbacteria bacterium RBG_13_48_7 TaxID=1817878 RepID=A0A1F7RQR3_9BACT|nr:MAG: 16S rRNA (guanine(966)-N(2))-methyltransferase RsmD [Candidatus Schekmanbacteria bacterium RBG_13_48_7]